MDDRPPRSWTTVDANARVGNDGGTYVRGSAAITRTAARFQIFIESAGAIEPLRMILEREGAGRSRITLFVRTQPDREVEIELPGGFALSGRARGALKAISGVVDVQEI